MLNVVAVGVDVLVGVGVVVGGRVRQEMIQEKREDVRKNKCVNYCCRMKGEWKNG